ncbi:hypothetical protein [Sphingobacterium sp. SYP-B4668]|nr:hypothetical protein [Sphingobacterium sp. SYP-B4668]
MIISNFIPKYSAHVGHFYYFSNFGMPPSDNVHMDGNYFAGHLRLM